MGVGNSFFCDEAPPSAADLLYAVELDEERLFLAVDFFRND
jgi:hypothetical protein